MDIDARMYYIWDAQPTRSVVEALSLKLVSYPQIEILRVVLEKCDAVDDADEKLTTTYAACALGHTVSKLVESDTHVRVSQTWTDTRCVSTRELRVF
jgi:hypothetical protein